MIHRLVKEKREHLISRCNKGVWLRTWINLSWQLKCNRHVDLRGLLRKFRTHNFLSGNNYAIIAWMKIFTIAEWFIDRHGTAKPKRVMTFGNCLFKLRDVKIKQQLLCSAIIIKSDYLFCHHNAKNKLCKLKTIPLWSDLWLRVSREAGEPLGKDLVFETDFDCIRF